jgi:hypothetical protein
MYARRQLSQNPVERAMMMHDAHRTTTAVSERFVMKRLR